MSEEQKQEEVVEQEQPEVKAEEVTEDKTELSTEELKQLYENAKAENARKAEEIRRLKEETEAKPVSQPVFNADDVSTWKDHELKAALKMDQWAHLHDKAQEEIDKRRYRRWQQEEQEKHLRMNSELERKKLFPETFDPTNPMSIKMSELMYQHRLDNTPAGRLIAAKLAASELQLQKARNAGRKQEQDRQADVKANFSGESSRPAPKVSDKVKLEELHKRAMSGDEAARREWMSHKIDRLNKKGQ